MLTLPEPYYRDEAVTIYHARMEDILPCLDLSEVAMVLADPPYGIGIQERNTTIGGGGSAGCKKGAWANTVYPSRIDGDGQKFHLPETILSLLDSAAACLWGANHYSDSLATSSAWLVWDKWAKGGENNFADAELAWTNFGGVVRVFRHYWNGLCRDSEQEQHWHPTQKPVALMKWVLGLAKLEPGALVLDPYTGSGPVLRACKDLGYRAIGIDSLEWCCERAAERCRQEVLAFGGQE